MLFNKLAISSNITKSYLFTRNEKSFVDKIKNELENNKKISIACTSLAKCIEFENALKDIKIKKRKIQILTITSKVGDEVKNLLKNYKEELPKYDLLIYSPCVSAGVDINFKYFHSTYSYVCSGSCLVRDLLQMLFRVRQTESNDINMLFAPNMRMLEMSNFYTYDEVAKSYPNISSPFDRVRIHNRVEELNSLHYFYAVLLHFIKKKGHTYEVLDTHVSGIVGERGKTIRIKQLVSAKNIDNKEHTELIKKQNNNELDEKGKDAIEKHSYATAWNIPIKKVNAEFLKKAYGKFHILKNYDQFGAFKDDSKEELEKQISECQNINKIGDKKCMILWKYLRELGFESMGDSIDNELFNKNKINIINNIDKDFKITFGLEQHKNYKEYGEGKHNKKFLGFFNKLLKNYGVEIKVIYADNGRRNPMCIFDKSDVIKLRKNIKNEMSI